MLWTVKNFGESWNNRKYSGQVRKHFGIFREKFIKLLVIIRIKDAQALYNIKYNKVIWNV